MSTKGLTFTLSLISLHNTSPFIPRSPPYNVNYHFLRETFHSRPSTMADVKSTPSLTAPASQLPSTAVTSLSTSAAPALQSSSADSSSQTPSAAPVSTPPLVHLKDADVEISILPGAKKRLLPSQHPSEERITLFCWSTLGQLGRRNTYWPNNYLERWHRLPHQAVRTSI